MPRNRNPRPRPAGPSPDEPAREETLLEATVRLGIQALRDASDNWTDTVWCLQTTSDFEDSLVRSLVLDWMKNRKVPPEAQEWLQVKLLARFAHALHLHRQLQLAPPPGLAPWPPAERLSDVQWLWLLLDSWLLVDCDFVIFFLIGYESPPEFLISRRSESLW